MTGLPAGAPNRASPKSASRPPSRPAASPPSGWAPTYCTNCWKVFSIRQKIRLQCPRRGDEELHRAVTRIDVLINNAGFHAFKPRVTTDGYSELVAAHYL